MGPDDFPLLASDDRHEVVEQRWVSPPTGCDRADVEIDWSQPVKAVDRVTGRGVWLWRMTSGVRIIVDRFENDERETLAISGCPPQIVSPAVAAMAAEVMGALDPGFVDLMNGRASDAESEQSEQLEPNSGDGWHVESGGRDAVSDRGANRDGDDGAR